MISTTEYLSIVNEEYDLSDPYTKKKVLFCNEAQKNSNIEHLTNRLYKHIKEKSAEIDFGSIPRSRGDITKIENYQNLIDCIDIIHRMVVEYGEDTTLIDEISTAVDNIQRRERAFSKSFVMNVDFPIMIYNTTVLSIVSGVSLLILTCIEYVKNGDDTFKMAFDKAAYVKTKDHVLYQDIIHFNKTCNSRLMDKMIDECIKNNAIATQEASLKGIIVGATASYFVINLLMKKFSGYFGIIRNLLWIIRRCCYYFQRIKLSVHDWLTIQADFLQMNADNLKYRDDRKDSDEHRDKVYNKQMKWVERFRKVANWFALKDTKAQKESQKDEDNEKRRPYDNDDDNNDNDENGGLF